MAKLPSAPANRQSDPLETEACQRLESARKQKVQFDLDLREGYFFAAPHRQRVVLSNIKPSNVRPRDAAILNQSFAFEVTEDFSTVIVNTFLPEAEPWALRKSGPYIPEAARKQIDEQAKDADKRIFEAISASNFYSACGMGFNPDLALGTVGMWIDQRRLHEAVCCQPVPIRELEIDVGPEGDVDDRFVVRYTRRRHLSAVIPGVPLPDDLAKRGQDKPDERVEVRWGFWRLWDKMDDLYWRSVIMVGDRLVRTLELKGVGSCPLIVGRWSPSPEWAWGEGPLIKALPDLRHLDALAEGKIKNLDLTLCPPIAFPDDSFTSIEEGIESGCAYAIRPGTEGSIKNIYTPNPPDAAIYDRQDLEQRIKRLFFLDWPEQRGDTPPTATQWLDQMTMAQRRIGTPGAVFWREFCAGVFQRFQYLEEKGGAIKPLRVDGKTVALAPYNPAERAADQQDVAQFTRFVQIGGAAAPEEFKVWTDGKATLVALAGMMGVDKLWKQRSPADVQAAVQQISQLQQGTPPSAPAIPDQGGGPAPPANLAGPAPNQPIYQERSMSK